ncbi:MAG: hypothetical protein NTZ15_21790 [Burkholderiales bacterium]|nr:hypothetical protein [Burkholderiales bacterium]
MKHDSKTKPVGPLPARPSRALTAKQKQEKVEPLEVLGRHSNTGQKDHKVAR